MSRRASFLGLSSFFGGKMILLAPSKEHEEDKSSGRDRQPRPPSWPLSSFLPPQPLQQRGGLYLGKFPPRRPRSSSKVHVKVAATFRAARRAEHGWRGERHPPPFSPTTPASSPSPLSIAARAPTTAATQKRAAAAAELSQTNTCCPFPINGSACIHHQSYAPS